jgi:hypothetical protein
MLFALLLFWLLSLFISLPLHLSAPVACPTCRSSPSIGPPFSAISFPSLRDARCRCHRKSPMRLQQTGIVHAWVFCFVRGNLTALFCIKNKNFIFLKFFVFFTFLYPVSVPLSPVSCSHIHSLTHPHPPFSHPQHPLARRSSPPAPRAHGRRRALCLAARVSSAAGGGRIAPRVDARGESRHARCGAGARAGRAVSVCVRYIHTKICKLYHSNDTSIVIYSVDFFLLFILNSCLRVGSFKLFCPSSLFSLIFACRLSDCVRFLHQNYYHLFSLWHTFSFILFLFLSPLPFIHPTRSHSGVTRGVRHLIVDLLVALSRRSLPRVAFVQTGARGRTWVTHRHGDVVVVSGWVTGHA